MLERMKSLKPTGHVRSLDALRGVLSAFVVAAHAWQIFSYPYTGGTWANLVFGLTNDVGGRVAYPVDGVEGGAP